MRPIMNVILVIRSFKEQLTKFWVSDRQDTVYVVIFEVVLFSRISRVGPRENFHFNLCLFIVCNENIWKSWN